MMPQNATAEQSAPPANLFERYQDLQRYVGWSDDDAARIRGIAPLIGERFGVLVDDFYAELQHHPEAARVITGGQPQIERLKNSLTGWLEQLFSGPYDAQYVARRWRVGRRHVEIGLDQVYTAAAMSRLRGAMVRWLCDQWTGDAPGLSLAIQSLNRLIDLDLAIIEDAYEAEHLHRQRQAERLRSESTFRDLVEAAGCMIVILRPNGVIRYFSPFAAQLTGCAVDDVLEIDFGEAFLTPEDRKSVYENLRRAVAGEQFQGFESGVVCRDGALRRLIWNMRRLDQYDDEPVVLAVGHDITSLKEAQNTALRSERLAAIGQMSTGLAHESRAALQRIQACTELLEPEVAGNDEAIDLVQRIQKSQDHLHRMLDEVRGYAAPVMLDPLEVQLSGVWREAWELLATERSGRKATLKEEIDDVDLTCQLDHFRMVHTFRNLLENSLSVRQDAVLISIHCTASTLNGRPALRVTIRDNGPGFTTEQRKRAFEPFYTTKPKGTGLGMAIAQRNVEAHGGQIAINPSDKGAEIEILIPRQSE